LNCDDSREHAIAPEKKKNKKKKGKIDPTNSTFAAKARKKNWMGNILRRARTKDVV